MSARRPDPDELIRLLSHEIRNNTAALTSFIECVDVLLPDDASKELRSSAQEALLCVANLTMFHEQVSWIARWMAGVPATVPQKGDVREVLADLAVRVERLTVVIERPREPLPTTAAGNDLVRVLEVLVANGARYGRGPVQVSARASGKTIVIDIGDDGPAIARTLRDRAFEMREQAELRRESGSRYQPGCGLPIAKIVVEALGGQLEARGSDGAWAFRILLPRA